MKIVHYPYAELGKANHGWLDTNFHFSFANYFNPDRMGFGALRVINDDTILAKSGFDPHPHRDMEIITYVRSGAISHEDSFGNKGITQAGDVQVMSAGTGIVHSEYNLEDEATTLYQIWILPNQQGVTPQWGQHKFPQESAKEGLTLLVSGDGEAPLNIHQDAWIYGGKMKAKQRISQDVQHGAYVLVSKGSVKIGDTTLKKGDGAEITEAQSFFLEANEDAEVLVIDVPQQI